MENEVETRENLSSGAMTEGEARSVDEAKPCHPLLEAVKNCPAGNDPCTVVQETLANCLQTESLSEVIKKAVDESGMNVLMQAAWKGQQKTLKLLIDQVPVHFVTEFEK